MISLSHLKKCSSIIKLPSDLDIGLSLNFVTDSRKYTHPSAFVAIPGSKVDPLDIITPQLIQGCPLVFYQKSQSSEEKVSELRIKYPKTVFVSVRDSVNFLQELTHALIVEWKSYSDKNTIFAISGSNGKTTHKEMLAFILNKIRPGKVVATEKNNNNHLGVPLTLLNVTKKTEFVVLELGSNHPGEIKVLCDISSPNAGITTNIGATHLEFFGTEENVFREEGYLYHAVNSVTEGKGFYLINVDDSFLRTLLPFKGSITFGESSSAQAKISFLDEGALIDFEGSTLTVKNENITGRHNKFNLVICAFIAAHYYPNLKEQIVLASADFKPTKNRSEWIEFGGNQIFLDAYNANPSSMRAALEGFKESVTSQGLNLDDACVVMGDMNELGDSSPSYHKETGKFVGDLGFKNVYFVGRFAGHYLDGYPDGKMRQSAEAFKSEYRNECLKRYRIHFIKGSRSLQLESLFDIT